MSEGKETETGPVAALLETERAGIPVEAVLATVAGPWAAGQGTVVGPVAAEQSPAHLYLSHCRWLPNKKIKVKIREGGHIGM